MWNKMTHRQEHSIVSLAIAKEGKKFEQVLVYTLFIYKIEYYYTTTGRKWGIYIMIYSDRQDIILNFKKPSIEQCVEYASCKHKGENINT